MSKNLEVFGDPIDARALAQIERCLEDEHALEGALMADHHLGYSMPIGGVVIYEDAISPSGVGFDIACGNMCVKTNLLVSEIADDKRGILKEIQSRVAFGLGRRNATPIEHPLFESPVWQEINALAPDLKKKAAAQLGTVGSGNHYVDLLEDDEGGLWIANHFGSRGFGHTIATGFLNLGKNAAFGDRLLESEEPTLLSMSRDLGQTYFDAMELAGSYAYAGREYVIGQVLDILSAESVIEVHNHHNYAWRNRSDNTFIVRKGATPLTGDVAFIGGSMGDDSVIVRGKLLSDDFPGKYEHLTQNVEDIGALESAPHGAGRQLSRTKAAGKFKNMRRCNERDCQRVFARGETCPDHPEARSSKVRMRDPSTAAIDWSAVKTDLAERGIPVLGAGADEAPGAYKKLEEVLAFHSNVVVLERLRPIGVVMAGSDEHDPYKD